MKKLKISRMIDRITKFISLGEKTFYFSDEQYVLDRRGRTDGEKDWSIVNAGLDKLPFKGEGQLVGILDTGVDKNHKDLIGRVDLINFVPKSLDTDESKSGHGTFCAGQILANGIDGNKGVTGVAPMAKGICCKVLYGDHRDGTLLDFEKVLYNSIRSCWKNGCGVISMSIGFDHKSRLVEEALIEAVDNGVIPIAACGNNGMLGSNQKSYPASYKCCISVAAANEKGMPAWFSSTGVDGLIEEQPEVAVASQEYYWGCIQGNSYGRNIGTSMACPIVAGAAVLWREAMSKKGKLPCGSDVLKEFRIWLKSVSEDVNANGWDSSLGWGVLRIKESIGIMIIETDFEVG